jgi:hypothetical protein
MTTQEAYIHPALPDYITLPLNEKAAALEAIKKIVRQTTGKRTRLEIYLRRSASSIPEYISKKAGYYTDDESCEMLDVIHKPLDRLYRHILIQEKAYRSSGDSNVTMLFVWKGIKQLISECEIHLCGECFTIDNYKYKYCY